MPKKGFKTLTKGMNVLRIWEHCIMEESTGKPSIIKMIKYMNNVALNNAIKPVSSIS